MVERRRGKSSRTSNSRRRSTRGGGQTAAAGPRKPAGRRGKAKAGLARKAAAKQVVGGPARNGGPAKTGAAAAATRAGATGSKTRQAPPARKGIRVDGRRAGELRPVRVTPNYSRYAEGSVLMEMGHTRVLCSASVEAGVPRFLRDTGSGWVTAEYGMLPRATHTRSSREVSRGRVGGRTSEIQRLIGRSLRAIIDLEKLGERTIWIDCDVLQADGGTRTASITGAFIALGLAADGLLRSQAIEESPLREPVAAISVGIVDGRPAVDLCYEEDSAADVDMNIVMTGSGRFVEVQGTAERNAFTVAQMGRMTQLAADRIADLCKLQRTVLAEAGVVLPKGRRG